MIKKIIKNKSYIQHTLSDYYCDLDELKDSERLNMEYWSEFQCKHQSLKTYFKTQLDFKIRYLVNLYEIPDDYYIEFRNYVPPGGKLTQEFIIWNEDDWEDTFSYICVPKNQANDGINNKASLIIFKNGMEYKHYTSVNFLELKQKLNKKILGKSRDKRYFNRNYKKHNAKAKYDVYHKHSKKRNLKMAKLKGDRNE